MAMLLQKWETLVVTTLNPANGKLQLLSDSEIQDLIQESEAERENIRAQLIEAIVEKSKVSDKQQYVQLIQSMLIRLLDKLHRYRQIENLTESVSRLYCFISKDMENTLEFIEQFFGNYIDRNEKVPLEYLSVAVEDLARQLDKLRSVFRSNGSIDLRLSEIVANNFGKFCARKATGITYNELMYEKELMNELLSNDSLSSELIRDVLFFFNFNDDDYIAYLYENLSALTDSLPTKSEKVAALRLEQKNINQSRSKLNYHLSVNMTPLKEQINHWIEEEIKFLERELTPGKTGNVGTEIVGKIHTTLSVAKLALLIRLMVIDKIIMNRTVAEVLRLLTKTVTTVQKSTLSFGSLETKYHNPDRATISSVREMLFRWINLLNKL